MANELTWELVCDSADMGTYKAAVPGGWLYRHEFPIGGDNGMCGQTMVFVPGRQMIVDALGQPVFG
jgi:hypothetical protein